MKIYTLDYSKVGNLGLFKPDFVDGCTSNETFIKYCNNHGNVYELKTGTKEEIQNIYLNIDKNLYLRLI
jgi:hypothetical protein